MEMPINGAFCYEDSIIIKQLRTRNAKLNAELAECRAESELRKCRSIMWEQYTVDALRERDTLRAADVERLVEAAKWYQEKAVSINKFLLTKKTDAVMAIVTELSLDCGNRLEAALEPFKEVKCD